MGVALSRIALTAAKHGRSSSQRGEKHRHIARAAGSRARDREGGDNLAKSMSFCQIKERDQHTRSRRQIDVVLAAAGNRFVVLERHKQDRIGR